MAAPRTHGALLEQSRRRLVLAVLILAICGLALGGAVLAGRRPGPAAPEPEGLAWPVPSASPRIVVEVFNATSTHRGGLARIAVRVLRAHGFDVVAFGTGGGPSARTWVAVRRGGPRAGRAVARALGVDSVVVAPDTLRLVDASVFLGDDYHPVVPLHP